MTIQETARRIYNYDTFGLRDADATIEGIEKDIQDHSLEVINYLLDLLEEAQKGARTHENIYCSNAEPTALVLAESKKEAVKITRKQAVLDIGDCDDNWTAYEINEYFKDDDDPIFFGWVKSPEHNYLIHA